MTLTHVLSNTFSRVFTCSRALWGTGKWFLASMKKGERNDRIGFQLQSLLNVNLPLKKTTTKQTGLSVATANPIFCRYLCVCIRVDLDMDVDVCTVWVRARALGFEVLTEGFRRSPFFRLNKLLCWQASVSLCICVLHAYVCVLTRNTVNQLPEVSPPRSSCHMLCSLIFSRCAQTFTRR